MTEWDIAIRLLSTPAISTAVHRSQEPEELEPMVCNKCGETKLPEQMKNYNTDRGRYYAKVCKKCDNARKKKLYHASH